MIWRDWWRGWSERDLDSALRKTRSAASGAMIPLTEREFRAHADYSPMTITGIKSSDTREQTMMTNKLISEIRDRRNANNVLWMRLLELAIEHAPVEAKITLRAINGNDRAISDLLAELAQ